MFKPNRQPPKRTQSLAAIKLPQLWSIPGIEHVSEMLSKAQKEKDRAIEQYWSVEGQEDKIYILSVKCDDEGDPLWIMCESKLTDRTVLWEHRTSDTALIHTIVLGESAGEVTETKDTSDFPTSISLPQEEPQQEDPQLVSQQLSIPPGAGLQAPAQGGEVILQGDIRKVQLTTVLQSIQMGKMTGRLAVRADGTGVDIYFDDGEPAHATDGIDTGDDVLLDLISLQAGKFQFMPDERIAERTVHKSLEALLMEAITLVDQSRYLEKEGLTSESYIINRVYHLSAEELQASLSKGIPVDTGMQRQFLGAVGEVSSLGDVLRSRPLKRSQWVPILFNLSTLKLVSISDKPPAEKRTTELIAEEIDFETLESSLKPIQRSETGILIYPAFQFFIAQEVYRFQMCSMPVSLIVFSIGSSNELPMLLIRDVMKTISEVKRPIDLMGHFKTFDYGLILPNTGTRSAAVFAQRFQETIAQTTYSSSGIAGNSLDIKCGIAGIPENCTTMGQLLSAAQEAKKRAEETSAHVVLYQE